MSTYPDSASLRPGFGYWNVTRHPIGGDFRRCPREGVTPIVTNIEPLRASFRGATHKGQVGAMRVAFSLNALALCRVCHAPIEDKTPVAVCSPECQDVLYSN